MIWILTCIISITPVVLKCDHVNVDKDTVFCLMNSDNPKAHEPTERHKEVPIAMAPREKCMAIAEVRK